MVEEKKKRNWGHIVLGILLILCGLYFISAPLLTLVALTLFLGIALLIAGIYDAIFYFRYRGEPGVSVLTLIVGILNIIIAIFIFFEPLVMAPIFPWMIGISITVFGISEIIGAFQLRKLGMPAWGWAVFAGIMSILFGFLIFLNPLMVPMFIGCFVVVNGITMIISGFSGN